VKKNELKENKKVFGGKCLETLFRSRFHRYRLGLLVSTLLKLPIRLFTWASDYTGPLASLVKAVPILMMFAVVLYPWWSLPFWMTLSLAVGEPLNYIVYVVWLGQWVITAVIAFTVAYIKET